MVTELFVFFVLDSLGKLGKVFPSISYVKYPFGETFQFYRDAQKSLTSSLAEICG